MAAIEFNTGKVRFSYPHILEKNQNDKYSVDALIPKTDEKTIAKLKAAAKEIYETNKNGLFKGLEYDEVAKPWHDGDGRKPKGGAYGPECKGCYILSCATKTKPVVVGPDNRPLVDDDMIYPGVYGRVAVRLNAYSVSGKGINAYLNGVKTYGTGDRIGHTFDPNSFDDGEDYEFEDDGGLL